MTRSPSNIPASPAAAGATTAAPVCAGTGWLFDYTPAARALWWPLLMAGSAAMGLALWSVATAPVAHWAVALAVGGAALASFYPVRIPRTTYSLSTADLCVFLAMTAVGPAVAVLAAGADGACGGWRSSRRTSSRLINPATSMAAIGAAALLHDWARPLLAQAAGAEAATLLALVLAALLSFVATTLPLTSMMALKRAQPVSLANWFGTCAWVGATVVTAALLAGLLDLNARLFGVGVLAAVVLSCALAVGLMRFSFAHQEAEHAAQDAQLRAAEEAAAASQRRFTAAFAHAAVGMTILDASLRQLQVNSALAQLLGASEAELVGSCLLDVMHPADAPALQRLLSELPDREGESMSLQLRCRRRDGEDVRTTLHCSRFDDPAGGPAADGRCWIVQLHDITSRHLAEQRLHHIAFHDSLTDLANRACFSDRIGQALARAQADPAYRFAVLFLDLDRFKLVNDSLGHAAGNELLCQVGRRLTENARPQDLVARLGGDEFGLLCDGLADVDQSLAMARRISQALALPALVFGTEVVTAASIGIAIGHSASVGVDELLRDADLAMYDAKAAGRGKVVVFDATMHERMADRLLLEADLRRAIGEGKLTAAFQPIYDLEPMRLAGFEALARWEHPTRGAINPAVFIALAEDSGHIEEVTRWMIDHALSQLGHWHRECDDAARLTVNVNISGRDLGQPALVQHVADALARHGVPACCLTLEITETTLMNRLDESLTTLHALRALGVRFSIDDFGTGYSSLAYLGSLPIDSLKIDRSFVMAMDAGESNVEIVRTVLKLGHTLGKTVVAEGVETARQLQQLQRMGVDRGQGYLLSRPLRPAQVLELLGARVAVEV